MRSRELFALQISMEVFGEKNAYWLYDDISRTMEAYRRTFSVSDLIWNADKETYRKMVKGVASDLSECKRNILPLSRWEVRDAAKKYSRSLIVHCPLSCIEIYYKDLVEVAIDYNLSKTETLNHNMQPFTLVEMMDEYRQLIRRIWDHLIQIKEGA